MYVPVSDIRPVCVFKAEAHFLSRDTAIFLADFAKFFNAGQQSDNRLRGIAIKGKDTVQTFYGKCCVYRNAENFYAFSRTVFGRHDSSGRRLGHCATASFSVRGGYTENPP